MARPHLDDAERRRRLAVRHHLAAPARSVEAAVRAAPVLHSSDPATPHLSLRARVDGFTTDDLHRALLEDRSLWRLHAMRRTLFVAAVEDGPLLEAAAGRKVANGEQRRVGTWLGQLIPVDEVAGWMQEAREDVLAELRRDGELSTADLHQRLPRLAQRVTVGSGKYTQEVAVGSRLLYLLGMRLDIVRTRTAGTWRASQYAWAATDDWFAPTPVLVGDDKGSLAAARAQLARRHLAAFGPVTATDLQWWTGWTKTDTGRALQAIEPDEVDLDHGQTGYVLAGDSGLTPAPAGPAVALLPSLDHTIMGWKQRTWLLGGDDEVLRTKQLYDRNGNVGPTVLVDGELVGAWSVRPDGEAVAELVADIGAEARDELDRQLAQLTAWLDGTSVVPRFPTPLEKRLRTA